MRKKTKQGFFPGVHPTPPPPPSVTPEDDFCLVTSNFCSWKGDTVQRRLGTGVALAVAATPGGILCTPTGASFL